MKTETTTTKKHRIELTREDIIELFRTSGSGLLPKKGTSVSVMVPGGGDWSNTQLDIDSATPLVIEYEETETT